MSLQRRNRGRDRREAALTALLLAVSMVSMVIFAGIAFFLITHGLKELSLRFLFTKTDILEYFSNTVLLLLMTLPLVGMMGVFGAVYLCEYIDDEKKVHKINLAIEVLTGIPSIVFGLFGMVFFGELLHMGYSLLTGALTLTMQILPVMIENVREILEAIPKGDRMGALALGAGKWHMIRTILLPRAASGIAAGLTLSAGKVLGESAALLFTAGSKGSLSVALYMLVGKGQFGAAYAVALLLLVIMVFLNLLIQYIREKMTESKEGKVGTWLQK